MSRMGTHNRKGRARMMIAVAIEALGTIEINEEMRATIQHLIDDESTDENARFILEEILYAAERS